MPKEGPKTLAWPREHQTPQKLKKSEIFYVAPTALLLFNTTILYKLPERANKETSLIMGDFNYHVDWEHSEGEREQDRLFLDFIEASFMQQHAMEPTRGDNILDLVLTSDENMIENVSVGEHFNTSDHQVVRWGLVMEQTQEVKAYVKRPNFFKADYDLVRNRLKEKNLESAVRGLEVNDAWKKFNGIMREIIENNIPSYKKITSMWN